MAPKTKPPIVATKPAGGLRAADLLDAAALLILLLVVAMRPLISETYYSAVQPMVRAAGADLITSATTAWFDVAIWTAAICAAGAALLRRDRWRLTGVEVGWLVLAVAAILSTVSASNKRLATNAVVDWLSIVAIIFLLTNLCRDRRRIVLVLAVLMATGFASAVKCILQERAEFRETRELYEQTKAEFWQRQGVALSDPQVELFERRLRGAEASGFLPHSNTQAALLSLAGFAALAISDLCRRSRHAQVLVRAGALLLFATILTTGSRGAIGAAALGLLLWFAAGYCEPLLRRCWRGVLVVAWAVAIAAAVGVWGFGQSRGGLPGSSLEFRWQYWQIARDIIAENPWTGVGALNFDRAYLPHKPIDYPEEIKDPHNFILSTVAQFGLLGGAGLLLAMVGGSWVAARNWSRTGPEPAEVGRSADEGKAWAPFAAVVVIGFVLLRVWMMRQLWLSDDVGNRAAAMFDLGAYGLLWVVAFVGALWIAETFRAPRDLGTGAAAACACGAIAFLLHNTIDFAIFYPATLTAFAAVCGICFAAGRPCGTGVSPVRNARATPNLPHLSAAVPLPLAVAGALATIFLVAGPVARTESLLADARATLNLRQSISDLQAAAAADPLDPTALEELAPAAARTESDAGLDLAIQASDDAILRDPESADLYRLLSRLQEARFHRTGSETAMMAAIGAARQALSLYPSSPEGHLDLAGIFARAAAQKTSPELALEAINQYEKALALDQARPGTDEPRKRSREWREDIEKRIARLREIAASQPASAAAP
jgi:hypothetical protein